MALSQNTMGKYFTFLEKVKGKINEHGKDFTHQQFADLFGVSRKTFESFYNCKIIRFDLLFELSDMYEIEIYISE